MSYRIQYGPPQKGERVKSRMSVRTVSAIAVVMLALAVIIVLSSPQMTAAARDFFCPGDPEVTKAAFSEFMESVKGGDPIGQAITAFCREIIEGAAI